MSHPSTHTCVTWPQWRRSKPINQWRHLTSYLPESHTEVIWRIDTGCEEKTEGWGGGNCGSGTSSGEQVWDCSVGRKTVLRSVSTDKLIPNTSNTHDGCFYSASRQKSVQFIGTQQQKAPCWLNKSGTVLCESDCLMLLAANKRSSTRLTVLYFLSSLNTKYCFVHVPLTPRTALLPSPLHRVLLQARWSTGLNVEDFISTWILEHFRIW